MWKQDPGIQELEEDGSQRDGGANCKEEYVGYVDMWDSFVGNEGLYFRDGLHLSGKGAVVLAEGLSGAVASGLGKVRYLN